MLRRQSFLVDAAGQTTSLKVNWKVFPGFDPITAAV